MFGSYCFALGLLLFVSVCFHCLMVSSWDLEFPRSFFCEGCVELGRVG